VDRFENNKLTQALVKLSGILFTQRSLNDDLERLVRLAAQVIPQTSGVSISMVIDGGFATVATTDQVTMELDLVQYDNSEGPCITALGGPIVRIGYIPVDERFPHFAIGAADRRVLSSLSIPIKHEDRIVGSLNLYSHQAHGFDQHAEMQLSCSPPRLLSQSSTRSSFMRLTRSEPSSKKHTMRPRTSRGPRES
jgi:GAF domain-containing protein